MITADISVPLKEPREGVRVALGWTIRDISEEGLTIMVHALLRSKLNSHKVTTVYVTLKEELTE